MESDTGSAAVSAFVLFLLFLLYLLPTIIARLRGHQSVNAIALVNLLFGWTGIGWVFALIWAFTGVWRRA